MARAPTYGYDANGDVTSIVTYDANGNVTSSLAYTYNASGQPVTVISQNGTWTYGYNAAGELTSARLRLDQCVDPRSEPDL